MKDIFSDNGPLQAILGNYEYRDEQYRMAQFVLEKLYDRGHALIEAGTGTGKTLAYLVPAVAYAVESGKKITLTTETKTLQKQL
ncbi:MAG TPA: DEAD/DEAH box helicase, partial [Spirochaetota bacterium]|nr:DEAD/DEAH box helicase [Spirochaetota bacterium]